MVKEIDSIAKKLRIPLKYIEHYGNYKAKINFDYYDKIKNGKNGKLILVTAINPTPAGEGKTTQSIGLSMALNKLGKKSIAVLREPSLGPVFGSKGGAVGGGASKIVPADDIDLHFNGDFHAITSANNLLCAVLDNHIFQGNELNIDKEKICIKRVIDMNDRSLRQITTNDGIATGFEITASCELMAICCLAENQDDLRSRIGSILVAYSIDNKPIYAKDLNVVNAMMALLKYITSPNLVQTTENTPCLVHLGPFANIAHGCNSVIATKLGMKLCDYTITEAGFGADLGAEKFLDIKCRSANIKPDAVVLVTTIKALKYNGDSEAKEGILKSGTVNLKRHIENLKKFNLPVLVCLNKFDSDTQDEIDLLKNVCRKLDVPFEVSTSYSNGSKGAIDLAKKLLDILDKSNNKNNFKFLYNLEDSIKSKINTICREIYHAKDIIYSDQSENEIKEIEKLGLDKFPICIAKTPLSFSDNPKLLGAPNDFEVNVKHIKVDSGAKFIVVYLGDILTMPGLAKNSRYLEF